MTDATVTDSETLRAQLDEVRRDAVDGEQEEAVFGECGLAAPIFDAADAADAAIGAIGVVVPVAGLAGGRRRAHRRGGNRPHDLPRAGREPLAGAGRPGELSRQPGASTRVVCCPLRPSFITRAHATTVPSQTADTARSGRGTTG